MINLEPPRTRYDLRFGLAGIPVRIHPLFWLVTGMFGLQVSSDAVEWVMWIGVVLVSILVHELGHAVSTRYFGYRSRIILHHFGGLATIEPPRDAFLGEESELSPRAKIIITAAGPAAGFALAGLLIGVLCLLPINFRVESNPTLGLWFRNDLDAYNTPVAELNASLDVLQSKEPGSPDFNSALNRLSSATGTSFAAGDETGVAAKRAIVEQARHAVGEYARHRRIGHLIGSLLFVNIFWGLMNLLPVFPLDGGQIARELYCARQPFQGLEKTFTLSAAVAAIVAVLGLVHFGINSMGLFFALLFGVLAFSNYRMLVQVRQFSGGYGGQQQSDDYEPEDWWKR